MKNNNIPKQKLLHKQRVKNIFAEFKKGIDSGLHTGRQVFFSLSPSRWNKMIWFFRSVGAIIIICGFSVVLDIFLLPFFHTTDNQTFKKILNPAGSFIFKTESNTEFAALKNNLAKEANGETCVMCTKGGIMDKKPLWKELDKNKEIVLTFDDGPDPKYTPQILDILKKENIKATFYVIGRQVEENIDLVERIYAEGHEIGNHTYTHPNLAEVPYSRTLQELRANRRLLECIIGRSTLLFRPPFSINPKEDKIPVSQPGGPVYYNIVETVDPRDWEEGTTPQKILNNVKEQELNANILLFHDGGGNREATIAALPMVIKHYRDNGYKFGTTGDFLDKTRDEVMPPVDGKVDAFLGWINRYLIIGIHKGDTFFRILIIAMILAISRNIAIAILAAIQVRKHKKRGTNYTLPPGKVSIIVPGYNEEINAVKTIDNLLKSDHPDFEIIFIDDGSKDKTFEIVNNAFKDNPQVKVLTKPNEGKASALNYAIDEAKGEYFVCIDADTQLKKDAVTELVRYFSDENVGAVAGNVKVGNEKNMITKWQSIEYITSQNFDKRAFDLLNCITVIPGAIGAFRKHAMEETGKFLTDTMAEDCELTIRLLKAGYTIKYNPKAIAVTEAPETLEMFMKQRFRWTFGIIQSFWKHKEVAFNPNYKALGTVAYPNMLIYQILLPLLSPLADIFMIMGIFIGNGSMLLVYYMIYLLVEAFGAVIAFSFEKEDIKKLIWLIPQRIIYRQLMFLVLLQSLVKAIKGEFMTWGFLKRTGSVQTLDA